MEHLGVKTFVHPDYLEFEVSGEIDRERIIQIIQGTSKVRVAKNYHRIFLIYLDQTIGEHMEMFEQQKVAIEDISRIRHEALNKGAKPVRVAVQVPSSTIIKHRFIENILNNRGITIQHFDNRQKALKWLMQDAKDLEPKVIESKVLEPG